MSLIHARRRRRKKKFRDNLIVSKRRRNLSKFVPDSDSDFAFTAEQFAISIASDPAAFELTVADSASISEAVKAFRAALARSLYRNSRTQPVIDAKDRARANAEAVVRKFGRIIRANPRVTSCNKERLRIKEPASKLTKRAIPNTRPVLKFLGSVAERECAGGIHVLRVSAADLVVKPNGGKPKHGPRVEIFVELVPPGEPVPQHPAERTGRPWFLRSYTRRRIEVQFPMPSIPMLVVYWARWADSPGNVGMFSKTCVARVEGWTAEPALLPDQGQSALARRVETKYVFIQTPIAGELPDGLNHGLHGDAEATSLSKGLLEAGMREATRLLSAE